MTKMSDDPLTEEQVAQLEQYLKWIDETPIDQIPPGEDIRDQAICWN